MLVSEKDYRLELDGETPSAERGKRLAISGLVVEDVGRGVGVRSLDEDLRFDIIEVFADFLTSRVMNSLKILAPSKHTPRITIDRLVICRETWRFAPSQLDFAFEKSPAQRFLGARQWALQANLPRFVFYKSPVEIKPSFLDLASPILVNLFAKAVRKSAQLAPAEGEAMITISEMLPAPDQLWLPDADGNLYSSELRLIACDPIS